MGKYTIYDSDDDDNVTSFQTVSQSTLLAAASSSAGEDEQSGATAAATPKIDFTRLRKRSREDATEDENEYSADSAAASTAAAAESGAAVLAAAAATSGKPTARRAPGSKEKLKAKRQEKHSTIADVAVVSPAAPAAPMGEPAVGTEQGAASRATKSLKKKQKTSHKDETLQILPQAQAALSQAAQTTNSLLGPPSAQNLQKLITILLNSKTLKEYFDSGVELLNAKYLQQGGISKEERTAVLKCTQFSVFFKTFSASVSDLKKSLLEAQGIETPIEHNATVLGAGSSSAGADQIRAKLEKLITMGATTINTEASVQVTTSFPLVYISDLLDAILDQTLQIGCMTEKIECDLLKKELNDSIAQGHGFFKIEDIVPQLRIHLLRQSSDRQKVNESIQMDKQFFEPLSKLYYFLVELKKELYERLLLHPDFVRATVIARFIVLTLARDFLDLGLSAEEIMKIVKLNVLVQGGNAVHFVEVGIKLATDREKPTELLATFPTLVGNTLNISNPSDVQQCREMLNAIAAHVRFLIQRRKDAVAKAASETAAAAAVEPSTPKTTKSNQTIGTIRSKTQEDAAAAAAAPIVVRNLDVYTGSDEDLMQTLFELVTTQGDLPNEIKQQQGQQDETDVRCGRSEQSQYACYGKGCKYLTQNTQTIVPPGKVFVAVRYRPSPDKPLRVINVVLNKRTQMASQDQQSIGVKAGESAHDAEGTHQQDGDGASTPQPQQESRKHRVVSTLQGSMTEFVSQQHGMSFIGALLLQNRVKPAASAVKHIDCESTAWIGAVQPISDDWIQEDAVPLGLETTFVAKVDIQQQQDTSAVCRLVDKLSNNPLQRHFCRVLSYRSYRLSELVPSAAIALNGASSASTTPNCYTTVHSEQIFVEALLQQYGRDNSSKCFVTIMELVPFKLSLFVQTVFLGDKSLSTRANSMKQDLQRTLGYSTTGASSKVQAVMQVHDFVESSSKCLQRKWLLLLHLMKSICNGTKEVHALNLLLRDTDFSNLLADVFGAVFEQVQRELSDTVLQGNADLERILATMDKWIRLVFVDPNGVAQNSSLSNKPATFGKNLYLPVLYFPATLPVRGAFAKHDIFSIGMIFAFMFYCMRKKGNWIYSNEEIRDMAAAEAAKNFEHSDKIVQAIWQRCVDFIASPVSQQSLSSSDIRLHEKVQQLFLRTVAPEFASGFAPNVRLPMQWQTALKQCSEIWSAQQCEEFIRTEMMPLVLEFNSELKQPSSSQMTTQSVVAARVPFDIYHDDDGDETMSDSFQQNSFGNGQSLGDSQGKLCVAAHATVLRQLDKPKRQNGTGPLTQQDLLYTGKENIFGTQIASAKVQPKKLQFDGRPPLGQGSTNVK